MNRTGALVLALIPCLVYAEPISYQGLLTVDSVLSEGVFDLEYRIFDALVDGQQLGQTVAVEDVVVSGGLLDVELDFKNTFDSNGSYLEVSVRHGDSEDVFEILAPRQRITPVPKAQHALKADSMTGLGWSEGSSVFGGGILKFGSGGDRVFLNRDEALLPFEYFGVHVEDFQTGGIVISNTDALGSTILAHVTDGVVGASQSFDGKTNVWTLQIDAMDVLIADSSGVSSPAFEYTSAITQSTTVAGDVFHSALGTPIQASFFGGGAYLTTPGDNAPLVAPVTLPHGATITKLVGRFEDNSASDIAISLTGVTTDGTLTAIIGVDSVGFVPVAGIQSVTSTEVDKSFALVDTFTTGYYIRVFSSSWPGDSSLRIWSVSVEYTVDGPN